MTPSGKFQDEKKEIQNDLILDYRTNVALYPEFQKYLRENQPPLLAVWGKNDPSFIPAGAEAFRKDLPNAEIHFIDSGHFALESHLDEIASFIIPFLKKKLSNGSEKICGKYSRILRALYTLRAESLHGGIL